MPSSLDLLSSTIIEKYVKMISLLSSILRLHAQSGKSLVRKFIISCLCDPCLIYFSQASSGSALFFHKASLKSDIKTLKNSSKVTQDQNNFITWVKGYNVWWDIQSCPHSIMVVAALSDIHFDFCFDLMLNLFFISMWIALGFRFYYFIMIFTLTMQWFLLYFTFNCSFSFVLQSCSILLLALNYFFFYFLFSPKKAVNFEWQPSATIVMVDLQFI